jgi:hypothetical protein
LDEHAFELNGVAVSQALILPADAAELSSDALERERAEQASPSGLGEVAHSPVPVQADELTPAPDMDESAAPLAPAATPCSTSDYPPPLALRPGHEFELDLDKSCAENYPALGQRLAEAGDLYRQSRYGGGLLLAPAHANITPQVLETAQQLAPVIADRVRVRVVKDGKTRGSSIPAAQLNSMLHSEVFLQQFRAVDEVLKVPTYLPDFVLTAPGYNNRGPGHRYLYVGPPAPVADSLDAVNQFLDVMAFASEADRTNAVALALTVQLRHCWPGAKPVGVVTSTKSHGGKDTVIQFAAGCTPAVSVDYQETDWAFRHGLVAALRARPDAGVVRVENARLGRADKMITSATLERLLTDPEPVLHSSKHTDALSVRNHLVLAISTNFGSVSEDLMNRALPVHLAPVGNVAERVTPIGNPKHEYLPAHRQRIEAELRGMVERWKAAGRPLDEDVRHPFTDWARTVGGILRVSGFKNFLANYRLRRTADDPVRRGLGLLGAARPGEWLTATDWGRLVVSLGLERALVPEADRGTDAGAARGLGTVLRHHAKETFTVETEDERLTLQLEHARRRFEGGEVSSRYRFEVLAREKSPEDDPS